MSKEIEKVVEMSDGSAIEPVIKRKKFEKLSTIDKIQYLEDYHQRITGSDVATPLRTDKYGKRLKALGIISDEGSRPLIIGGSLAIVTLASLITAIIVPSSIPFGTTAIILSALGFIDFSVFFVGSTCLSSRLYSAIFDRKKVREMQKTLDMEGAAWDKYRLKLDQTIENLHELADEMVADYNKTNKYQNLRFADGMFSVIDVRQHQLDIAQRLDSLNELTDQPTSV